MTNLKQLQENNDMNFVDSEIPVMEHSSANHLRNLALVGLSSPVAQIGMEVGVAALDELTRRAQLARECLRAIGENECVEKPE
jgi:hypothetical protein